MLIFNEKQSFNYYGLVSGYELVWINFYSFNIHIYIHREKACVVVFSNVKIITKAEKYDIDNHKLESNGFMTCFFTVGIVNKDGGPFTLINYFF